MIGVQQQPWTTTSQNNNKKQQMMVHHQSLLLLCNNKREQQLWKRMFILIGATILINQCSFGSCTVFKLTTTNRRGKDYSQKYDNYDDHSTTKQPRMLPLAKITTKSLVSVVRSPMTTASTITKTSSERNERSPSSLFQLLMQNRISRGGGIEIDDEDEEEDDDFDDDDDDLLGMLDGEDTGSSQNVNDADFVEGNMIDRLKDSWNNKTPPITKIFLSCSVLCTLVGYLTNQNEYPTILNLDWKLILTRGQFWRILTPFFNLGPLGLGYIMTCQFVWVYMSTIERLNYKKPYDFWYMILFGQLSMIIGYTLLQFNPKSLGHNLSTYLVYIWSRYHEGLEVNMFDMFQTRAELLPWFFLGQTYLLEGEMPVLDFLGIIFGHIYYHYYTVGLLHAPQPVQHWYKHGTDRIANQLRELYKQVSTDFDADVQ